MARRTAAAQQHRGRFRFGDDAVVDVLEAALLHEGGEPRLTHGFHTYPAGLHPDAARDLVQSFEGQRMLDPFCGGGTTLIEARVAGRSAVGRDISPIAVLVAKARTATPDEELLTLFRSTARKLTEAARHARDLPPEPILTAVEKWYARHALWELEAIRKGIHEADPRVRNLLWACFSSLLVKVSWRASDTSGRREKHHRPAGTTAVLFHKKVRELARREAELRDAVPPGTPEADVAFADARSLSLDRQVQLVVTSPPYPSTYDYLPLQHLRHVWLEERQPSWEAEIGPRRDWRDGAAEAKKRWAGDTMRWTARAAALLEPGGHLVVVIGDGLTPQGGVDTAKATEDAAREAGLAVIGRASVERPDHARNTVRWEHAFAFRK
ncbi:MAG: hypothetical protein H6737_30835 [Alphaproteobacteria bacterium]|nr:hypothetical protein [Alphaproteobacteria bacterium]